MYASYYPQMQMMAQNPQYQAQYQQYQQYFAQQAAAYNTKKTNDVTSEGEPVDAMAQIQQQYQQYYQANMAQNAAQANAALTPEQAAAMQQQYLQFYNQQHHPQNQVAVENTSQDINVPAALVGSIIGKGGSNIKEMRTTTGCQVSMTN